MAVRPAENPFQPAHVRDIPGILALMRDYYGADRYPFDAVEAERAARELIADPGLGEVRVVREGGRVVAYLAVTFGFSLEYRGRDAFVDELVVAPAHRGRGLGAQAMAMAESICRQAGVRALHLEVERGKDHARRMYENAGFVEHSRYLLTRLLD